VGAFILGVVLQFAGSPALAQSRYALLIGNEAYAKDVGPLSNPLNDISLLRRVLESSALGFKVVVVPNAGLATLHKSIQAHIQRVQDAGEGTLSFIYYSGHGAADPKKVNYLIPTDVTDTKSDKLWTDSLQLKADLLDKLTAQAPSAIHFVVVDACRSELQLPKATSKDFKVDGKAFTPLASSPGTLLAFATAANRTASDSGEGSGPYARALSEEIVKPGVEAVSMFRSVQLRISASIGQFPHMDVPAIPAVYFAKSTPSTTTVASQAPIQTVKQAFDAERQASKKAMRERFGTLKAEDVWSGAVYDPNRIWPSGKTITVCFWEVDRRKLRAHVASTASQWTLYGNVEFDFGSLENPRVCDEGFNYSQIRVSFSGRNNSFIGTDALNQKGRVPTLTLGDLANESQDEVFAGTHNGQILHEFGHALGLTHSNMHPTCEAEIDWDFLYDYYAPILSRDAVNTQVGRPTKDMKTLGSFDKYSVMQLRLPIEAYFIGPESPCRGSQENKLSLQDKLAMFLIYK
jgi:hypothetical protein